MRSLNFLNNLKLKAKIIGGFAVIILIFAVVVSVYNYANMVTHHGYGMVINSAIKAAFLMDEAKLNILQGILNIDKAVLYKDKKYLQKTDEEMKKMQAQMDEVRRLAKGAGRHELMGLFDTIESHHNDFQNYYEKVLAEINKTDFQFKSDRGLHPLVNAASVSIEKIDKLISDIREEALIDKERFAEVTIAKVKKLNTFAICVAIIAGGLGVVIGFFISVNISRPVTMAVAFAIQMSKGDFSRPLEIDRKDEVGTLIQALNTMRNSLGKIIRNLKQSAANLNNSAADLTNISTEMTSGAEDTSDRANSVSVATEEMSTSLKAVTAAMEESSTNMNMVATAAEEMTSTINEIARNTENASDTTTKAVEQASNALKQMTALGEAAQAIGQVTETITEISEQTNLLALNATIEAARAGEYGKGFAVVANEIKDLANQTAEATKNIKGQIDSVQTTSASTGTEISEIAKIIDGVNAIVSTIAASVEEQSSATAEISQNINHASRGIQEVNVNVNESSNAADEITQNISQVNTSAEKMADSSNQVKESAEDLANMAIELNKIVDQFII